MKSYLFIISIFLFTNSFCQKNSNEKFVGEVEQFPMINGAVYKMRTAGIERGDPGDPALITRSTSSKVFSITNGTVTAVFNIADELVIVIKGIDSNFYCHLSFDTVYFSIGNQIKTGDLLGQSHFNEQNKLYEITIMIADKNGDYFNENKIWEIIRKLNNNPIVPVCDATVLN